MTNKTTRINRGLDTPKGYCRPSPLTSLLWIAMAFTVCVSTRVVNAQAFTSFSDASGKHLFYLGGNGYIQELSCAAANNCSYGASWTAGPVPNSPQPSILTSLTGFSDASGEHVFFEDGANYINQLYFNGTWVNKPLNVVVMGYPTGHSDNGVERLFYQTLDQHIHLLSSTVQLQQSSGGGSWVDSDLSAQTNAALALRYGPLSSLPGLGGGPRLFYVGANNHIYQLWDQPTPVFTCSPKTGCQFHYVFNWVNQDLTFAAETTGASPDPVSTPNLTSVAASDVSLSRQSRKFRF
jgi:hypothetical protein